MPRIVFLTSSAAGGGSGLTQEQVEDFAAAMDTDSSHLDFTYTDNGAGAGTVTATIKPGSLTDTEIAAANKDGAAGTASMRTLGTGATQAAAGNAAPNAHAASHVLGGSDAVLGIPKTYRLAADVSTSNQTATTGISSDSLAAGTYKFVAQGSYSSTSLSTGVKVAIGFDGTATAAYYGTTIYNTSTASFTAGTQTLSTLQGTSAGTVSSTSGLFPFTIHGTIVVSAAGVLTLQYAGSGSVNSVSLKAGADLTLWRVS